MRTYDRGDDVGLECLFTSSAGVAADPGSVTVLVRKPDGSSVSPVAASTVTGTWTASVVVDQSGHWFYSFTGTSPVVVVEEGQFYVRERKA